MNNHLYTITDIIYILCNILHVLLKSMQNRYSISRFYGNNSIIRHRIHVSLLYFNDKREIHAKSVMEYIVDHLLGWGGMEGIMTHE
jgi:hypothetical protein